MFKDIRASGIVFIKLWNAPTIAQIEYQKQRGNTTMLFSSFKRTSRR